MTVNDKKKTHESGYIYILQNDVYNPYVVKIGLTRHSPNKRAKQIYWGSTGVPLKFDIAIAFSVGDCVLAEKIIHQRLATFRVNPRREFFKIKPSIAIAVTFETCVSINQKMEMPSPEIMRFEQENANRYLSPIPDIFEIVGVESNLIRVSLGDLKPFPVGTSKLSVSQIDRIRTVLAIFQPVYDTTLKDAIETFSRDTFPEAEIVVWENMAKVFLAFDSLPGHSASEKKDAFKLILTRSLSSESNLLDSVIKHSNLDEESIQFILSKYQTGSL